MKQKLLTIALSMITFSTALAACPPPGGWPWSPLPPGQDAPETCPKPDPIDPVTPTPRPSTSPANCRTIIKVIDTGVRIYNVCCEIGEIYDNLCGEEEVAPNQNEEIRQVPELPEMTYCMTLDDPYGVGDIDIEYRANWNQIYGDFVSLVAASHADAGVQLSPANQLALRDVMWVFAYSCLNQ